MTPDLTNTLDSIALSLKEIAIALRDLADAKKAPQPTRAGPPRPANATGWRAVAIKGGKMAGTTLGQLADDIGRDGQPRIQWWIDNYQPRLRNDGTPWPDNLELREALDQAKAELAGGTQYTVPAETRKATPDKPLVMSAPDDDLENEPF